MPFKRHHEADLVAWDAHAPVTVAQVMIMGGALRPNFDTRAFDRQIGRRSGQPTPDGNDMRLMVTALPTLRLTVVGTTPMADFFDESRIRQAWQRDGAGASEIKRRLNSRAYKQARQRGMEFVAVANGMGPRFREVVTRQPRGVIVQALNKGAVAVTANVEDGSLVMLLASKRSPGKVKIYFPDDGTKLSTIDDLTYKHRFIDLSSYGATLHAM